MLLGDEIAKVTTAMGIKPCEACKKRADVLNRWSRRGFLKSGLAGILAAARFRRASQLVGAATTEDALLLTRLINTKEADFWLVEGIYGSKKDLAGSKGLPSYKERGGINNNPLIYVLNFDSDELMPGWTWDFVSTRAGYTFVLSQKLDPTNPNAERYVFASDQSAVIYRSMVTAEQPSAKNLDGASAFPGAVPFNHFKEGKLSSIRQTVGRLTLRLVSYTPPQGSCGCTSCAHDQACCEACDTDRCFNVCDDCNLTPQCSSAPCCWNCGSVCYPWCCNPGQPPDCCNDCICCARAACTQCTGMNCIQ